MGLKNNKTSLKKSDLQYFWIVYFWLWRKFYGYTNQKNSFFKRGGGEDDLILPCSVRRISNRLVRYSGSKYLKKNTPLPSFWGNIAWTVLSEGDSIPSKTNTSKVLWPKSRRLWNPLPLTITFFKNSFFPNISKNVRDIKKVYKTKFVGLFNLQ